MTVTTNIILGAIAIASFVLYLLRRNARLSREDD
jgi:hypothetical protein